MEEEEDCLCGPKLKQQYYFSVTYFLALLGVSTQEQHNNGNLVIINVRSREKVPPPTTNPLLCKSAARNAVLLPDLDVSTTTVRLLPTRTDVFAVAQQENLVYAGMRTGAMLRFDTRTTKSKAQVLFESGAGNGNTGLGVNPGIQRSSTVFVQPTHGGQALVVGYMDGRYMLTSCSSLPMTSALCAPQRNLVYAGMRTGAMLCFDTRTTKSKAQVLFESGAGNGNTGLGVNPGIQQSSTVFVQPTHGGQALVVGYMDGRLATYDLRFVRPAAPPVVTYSGNPSALLHNGHLGITLDPAERFLFAAGEDCRLRVWSLDSGAPVKPHALNSSLNSNSASSFNSAPPSQTSCNPFVKVFPAPLATLQVVNDDNGPAPMLWAGGGGEMWHWRLGV
ncbi:hypothetical protein B0H13DRAFT_2683553 [Mycena leptocephala]|nr:hypothetical protein B0H13DRAFT_2683553 [Mycena leptocephala]